MAISNESRRPFRKRPTHPPGLQSVPNQHQTQRASGLAINKLLRVSQQYIHVRVNALERALVLGLAPFETDDKLSTDPKRRVRGYISAIFIVIKEME